MSDVPIHLIAPSGELVCTLGQGVLAMAAQAEAAARTEGIAKRRALPLTLRRSVRAAGCDIDEHRLEEISAEVEQIRRGKRPPALHIPVIARPGAGAGQPQHVTRRSDTPTPDEWRPDPMATVSNLSELPAGHRFFEAERDYPDDAARAWYERLVGLDEHKQRLVLELEMLLYPERLEQWSRTHHGGRVLQACAHYRTRVPLILLEGDVGTGKTVLAETVGDALARHIGDGAHVHLLKINTQVRGTGQVGEMSDLIVQAFQHAEQRARQRHGDPILLLLDEADALAASREVQQMHHEDKAGLDTLLQRLDSLRHTQLRIAALFITNRPEALDPAIRRRVALDLHFDRPDDEMRAQLFRSVLPELNLAETDVRQLVGLTGAKASKNGQTPFTASDITDRLIPAALRRAYQEQRGLGASDLTDEAANMRPSPRWGYCES